MSAQPIIEVLRRNFSHFHVVVPFDVSKDRLIALDFTAGNKEISPDILDHTNQFMDYINGKLNKAGAKFGIGGYDEHRTVYSKSRLFNDDLKTHPQRGSVGETEPRRLHLGVDIWGKPHTHVMSPLDGIVHSFAFNDNFGDYGATIILSHQLEGISFYTLYGHLSLNDLKNLNGGESIEKGEVFAEFGIPIENGNWPPHLHFQIIIDLEIPVAIGRPGDYPGVCKYSEREKYLANCPDPDLVLQMMKHAQ